MRNIIGDLPPGLDKMFQRSIKSIMTLPKPVAQQCLRALYWRVPLNSYELIEAVAIGEMDDTWNPTRVLPHLMAITDNCANLISLVNHWDCTDQVHLYHPSVKDFLVQSPTLFSSVLPASIPAKKHDLFLLAENCLKYLSIASTSHPIFFLHASQNFAYYLRGAAKHSRKLCDLFIKVIKLDVEPVILSRYKLSSTCKYVFFLLEVLFHISHLSQLIRLCNPYCCGTASPRDAPGAASNALACRDIS